MATNNKNTKGKFRKKDDKRNKFQKDDPRSKSAAGKEDTCDSVKGYNDPDWYITDPSTAVAVASFPFGKPLGYPVDATRGAYVPDDGRRDTLVLPGIVRMSWSPSIGDTGDNVDVAPINLAAQKLYTAVRGANSGAKNYEPSDLMMYLLAMDSLYTMYYMGRRVYGTMMAYNVQNRYMPRYLVEAQGFDFESFQGNAAQLKGYLDVVRARLQGFAVPDHLRYFKRHQYLSENVFSDAPILKSTMYVTAPEYVWKYSGYSDERGGELVPEPILKQNAETYQSSLLTFEDYKNKFNEMMARVVDDVDIGVISGDIMKAFNSFYTLPMVEFDYSAPLVYDQWFLIQIHNAVLQGKPVLDQCKIQQTVGTNPNYGRIIATQYVCQGDKYVASGDVLLDATVNQPDPAYVVEMTRFVSVGEPINDSSPNHIVAHSATEILHTMYTYVIDVTSGSYTELESSGILSLAMDPEGVARALQFISAIEYYPMLVMTGPGIMDTSIQYLGTLNVKYNPLSIPARKLDSINNMAFIKLLT